MVNPEAFAKYHDEHAAYGGVSWEFHARAATFIRQQAADLAKARTRNDDIEAELRTARERILELTAELERAAAGGSKTALPDGHSIVNDAGDLVLCVAGLVCGGCGREVGCGCDPDEYDRVEPYEPPRGEALT